MRKICKNDEVIILAGKDKGKRGTVIKYVNTNYLIVHGINVAKKATKPNPATGITGGIINKLMPIHISNVALFNASSNKLDRIIFKNIDGKKVRTYKSDGNVVKI